MEDWNYDGSQRTEAPPPEDREMEIPSTYGTDDVTTGTGTSTGTTTTATSWWTRIYTLAIMTLMSVLRHVITPSLWTSMSPGRWLAFLASRYAQESDWGRIPSESISGGGSGLLYFNASNRQAYGVTPGSPWSEGWAVPAYIADGILTPRAWVYLHIPGSRYLAAMWRSHSAFQDEQTLAAAVALADAETRAPSVYWWARLVGLVLDVPYYLGLAVLGVYLRRWWMRRRGSR